MTRLALTNAHCDNTVTRSVIGGQVEMGVAVRMAVLELLARNVTNEIAGVA